MEHSGETSKGLQCCRRRRHHQHHSDCCTDTISLGQIQRTVCLCVFSVHCVFEYATSVYWYRQLCYMCISFF